MKSAKILSLFCLAASITGTHAQAQTKTPAERLSLARSLYYTPTAQGLRSFHCDLAIDWKDMLSRFGGNEVKDDNPFLKYLQSARLSVTDDLKSGGRLEWANTAVPPEGKEASVTQMKNGMQQMVTGFFDTWNGYMNGSMVPIPDATTTISAVDDGLHLHATATAMDVNESFDKNLLLTEAHVVTPEMDATAYPTFADTPDGRVVSSIRSSIRQPPTAPGMEVSFAVTYANVSNFRLPETLTLEVKNVGAFKFKLSGCSVNTSEKAADKL